MEIFVPSNLDDLRDLPQRSEEDHVRLRIMLANPKHVFYYLEEYATIEAMIRKGYSLSEIEGFIAEGLIRVVSVRQKGEE